VCRGHKKILAAWLFEETRGERRKGEISVRVDKKKPDERAEGVPIVIPELAMFGCRWMVEVLEVRAAGQKRPLALRTRELRDY